MYVSIVCVLWYKSHTRSLLLTHLKMNKKAKDQTSSVLWAAVPSPRFVQPCSIIFVTPILALILFLKATISAVNADKLNTLELNLNFDTISEILAGTVTGRLVGKVTILSAEHRAEVTLLIGRTLLRCTCRYPRTNTSSKQLSTMTARKSRKNARILLHFSASCASDLYRTLYRFRTLGYYAPFCSHHKSHTISEEVGQPEIQLEI